jgi:PAS domain-containing protein
MSRKRTPPSICGWLSIWRPGFEAMCWTQQYRYLRPYRVAQEGVAAVGYDIAGRISGEQSDRFRDIQHLVVQLVTEKEALISAIKNGHKQDALHYIEEGRGRELMVEIRREMGIFDRFEQQSVAEKLAQLSQDRTSTLFVVLGGGVFTFGLMVGALYLIARSIAAPLLTLATAVGSSPTGLVPAIPVLARTDEIGDLTRMMHGMSTQILGHLKQMEQSEAALRQVNEHLAVSEAKYRGLVDHAPFGIFTTKGMQITFSNRYNQELAGLDPKHPLDPDAFRARIHPEDRIECCRNFPKP